LQTTAHALSTRRSVLRGGSSHVSLNILSMISKGRAGTLQGEMAAFYVHLDAFMKNEVSVHGSCQGYAYKGPVITYIDISVFASLVIFRLSPAPESDHRLNGSSLSPSLVFGMKIGGKNHPRGGNLSWATSAIFKRLVACHRHPLRDVRLGLEV